MSEHAVAVGCHSSEEKKQMLALIEEFKAFCNFWSESGGRATIAAQSGVSENLTQRLVESFWELSASGEGDDKQGMAGISLACQYGIFLGMKMNKKPAS